jgi:hypothetical protein
MVRVQNFKWLLLVALVSCEMIEEPEDEQPRVYTEADGFNGEYEGSWTGGQSDRTQGTLTGPMKLTISNNTTVTGDIGPVSGSVRVLNGSINSSGAFTASAAADVRGCVVNFSGQLTTSAGLGTVNAAGSGTYVLVQSSTCNTNTGTWSVTRK